MIQNTEQSPSLNTGICGQQNNTKGQDKTVDNSQVVCLAWSKTVIKEGKNFNGCVDLRREEGWPPKITAIPYQVLILWALCGARRASLCYFPLKYVCISQDSTREPHSTGTVSSYLRLLLGFLSMASASARFWLLFCLSCVCVGGSISLRKRLSLLERKELIMSPIKRGNWFSFL